MQVENEFGFIGPDATYMRHMTLTMQSMLHNDVVWYTTDPPDVAHQGGPGPGLVFTCAPSHDVLHGIHELPHRGFDA